jgi:Cu(I)/Ag(I) efflux system membrane fusion protein
MKTLIHSILRHALRVTLGVALLATAIPSASAQSDGFTTQLTTALVDPYLDIQKALAADDLAVAKKGASAFLEAMNAAPSSGDTKEESEALIVPAKSIANSTDIAAARKGLWSLTQAFATLVKHMGTTRGTPLYLVHCPMAFGNSGADWLQADKSVANPYFGASMLRCGSVKSELAVQGTQAEKN